MKYIYQLVETNVDGCGTDSWEYVETVRELTEDELHILKECLTEAKRSHFANNPEEDYETWDYIQDAVELMFNRTGVSLYFCKSPLSARIEF